MPRTKPNHAAARKPKRARKEADALAEPAVLADPPPAVVVVNINQLPDGTWDADIKDMFTAKFRPDEDGGDDKPIESAAQLAKELLDRILHTYAGNTEFVVIAPDDDDAAQVADILQASFKENGCDLAAVAAKHAGNKDAGKYIVHEGALEMVAS